MSDLDAIQVNDPEGGRALLNDEPDHRFVLPFENYFIPNDINFQKGRYIHFMSKFYNYDTFFASCRFAHGCIEFRSIALGNNFNMIGAINNISFSFPSFPLLTQPELIRDNDLFPESDLLTFCDSKHKPLRCDGLAQCPCTQRLQIRTNATVELIIVDEAKVISKINHPFHLHGYGFHVMDMGQHPDGTPLTAAMVERMLLTRTFDSILGRPRDSLGDPDRAPALKDTIGVPSRGFVRLRFRADNPGFWFMHCHYEWHMAVGMALVVQVGETDEMVRPPADFPQCSNYLQRLNRFPIN